jgi:hypothetical protein
VNRRFPTAWRVLRLMLMALVVLAPAIPAEASSDRIALVQGGGGREAQHEERSVAPRPLPTSQHFTPEATFREVPRALPVARYLLHRALLN